jgi:hypothetical protein
MKLRTLLVAAGIAGALAPAALQAETAFDTTSPYSAAVNLDFRIIIPGFLRLRVGTAGSTIDQITFTVPAANVGDTTPIAGTGGDAAPSASNVSVQGNNGQVTITETNNSGGNGLGNGTPADGYINYSQISTTSSAPAALPAPTLSNAGGNTALPALTGTKITNQTAVWTYSYLNTTVPAAGTYGTSANGGRVTYTATMP